MTDNKIINALKCCISDDEGIRERPCKGCPLLQDDACSNSLRKYAFDLINRQKAEVERLKKEKHKLQKALNQSEDYRIIAKSEAYREFAERVKQISKEVTVPYIADTAIQEHKIGIFYYGKEDFDNALNKLLSNDMGRYDHYTDSFVKETAESNE